MKQITILNVAIQFDSPEKLKTFSQAKKVVDLINKTLSDAGLECQPQVFNVDGLKKEDLRTEKLTLK